MELLVEAAKPMIEVMVSRVSHEIDLLKSFQKELNKVQENILIIESIVLNMNTCTNDKAVQVWLKKIFLIIHSVENLLDVLAYEKQRSVVMKNKSQKSKTKKLKRLLIIAPLERISLRRKIGKWIKKINNDIKEAMEYANTIVSLKALARSSSLQVSRYTRDDGVNERLQDVRQNPDTSVFVGRESDVDSLVQILCHPPQDRPKRPSVVAIVGMGGIGKTCLAKNVYENKEVKSYFSERILITVSQDFNISENLYKMVEFLKGSHNDKASSEIAIKYLGAKLAGKRYLLVMDDVWNTNAHSWDAMVNELERVGGSVESMILATTRYDEVAITMNTLWVHRLSELPIKDGWFLFEQIAFANRSQHDIFVLTTIAKEIYKKCNGVPLAITSVSGILRTKRSIKEWKNMEESELWKLHDTGILPSLKLSYNHLPSPFIKKCFSVCSFFPKGRNFKKFELIDRWIALGLIQQCSDGILVEDIGENYFDVLLSTSFLLVHKRNEHGDATDFELHDLVYDLARSVSEHERLYLQEGKNENNAIDIQHLNMDELRSLPLNFPGNLVVQNLRSLESWKSLAPVVSFLMHAKYLRVLSLEDVGLEVVPESIAKLKCLKLLDLMYNPIRELPGCIMELYNLQSLLLYDCKLLLGLPEGLINLVNLRHLGLSCYISPTQGTIRQLTQLQILPPLQLSEEGLTISELECLHNVRGKLEIKGLELIKSKEDAELANLKMKTIVEELRLKWENNDNFTNQVEVLNALCPNPLLKVISITGYAGENFPSWLMYAVEFCNLQKIELVDCGKCSQLPTLGNLPYLKLLRISGMENLKRISDVFYYGDDLSRENKIEVASSSSSSLVKPKIYFPKLKEFALSNLPNLEEWCGDGTEEWIAFQSLEILVIDDCPRLTTTPHNFPSLQIFHVNNINSDPLTEILKNKNNQTSLKELHIAKVNGLTNLPEELLEHCTSLHTLKIYSCVNLVSLPNLSGLGSLRELEIIDNPELTSVPEGIIESCYSLEKLLIHFNPKVETIPDLRCLTRLSELSIVGMSKMKSQPCDWIIAIPCLRILTIGDFQELNEFPDMSFLLKMNSLKELGLYGWEGLQSVPTQLKHFTGLESLILFHFKYLEKVPEWIQNLSSLRVMGFHVCPKLKELASAEAMKHLTNLQLLDIEYCPLLAENVKPNGKERHKIPPHVEVRIIFCSYTESCFSM